MDALNLAQADIAHSHGVLAALQRQRCIPPRKLFPILFAPANPYNCSMT